MKTLINILVSIMILVPIASQAQPCHILKMADELELTEEQIEKLSESKIENKKAMIQLRADIKIAKLELREVMMNAKIDRKAALKKGDNISALKAQKMKKHLTEKLDRMNILTEEQRAKLHKMMKSRGHGMKGKGCHGKCNGDMRTSCHQHNEKSDCKQKAKKCYEKQMDSSTNFEIDDEYVKFESDE